MTKVYVFGHKNPDNDSIVSAAVYADFLNMSEPEGSDIEYVAARLGGIPPETQYVFERFDAVDMLPELLPAPDSKGDPMKVVLVDHNEYAQSAEGIRDMEIVEVLDHHRIGDIQTAAPIPFMSLPYGSTATLVTVQYMDTETPLPNWAAGALLSAVLTDTVILKSPTTTAVDHDVVELLAAGVEVDPQEFGMELFKVRSEANPFEPGTVLTTDLKEYDKDGKKVAIVQYESATLDSVLEAREALTAEMDRLATERGWDLFLFMATDIIKEGSELFAVGTTELADKAFGVDFAHGSVWMPGVLSRKKQVAAAIMDA
ncbi:MAG: manganese-dependent inorganic pyrophosphatase [Coriobacteriia bacterium]|nr:manganese-dependent inorganic pyrophosphatase [Coriobacteriia bacterium]MCL2745936.1 manganese-dependent inorganic pyrophosphatase [Coriobacteriia bacterium]MCL2871219.1 manganese-dependent inorganic pyrophosphatase [Coriobacteriia bacterium]